MKVSMFVFAVLGILAMSSTAFAQYCVPGFQNSYQCSGNWQQQLYINPDCSTYWSSVQYCANGCFNGFCSGTTTVSPSGCSVSASMTTPPMIQSGDLAATTVLLTNTGGTGGTVNVNAYLCRADGSNCFNIGCSSSSVYVPANSVAYDVCSTRNYYGYYAYPYSSVNPYNNPNVYPYNQNQYPYQYPYNYPNVNNPYYYYPGMFRIRVDFNGCTLATTMYTGTFQIQPNQYCTAGNTDNFRCSGNARQGEYQFADCRTEWRNVETCSNGCLNGVCQAATSTATATVTTTVTAQPKYNLPDLGIVALIFAIIVLFIIFIRLVSEGSTGGKGKGYHGEPEYWRLSEKLSERFSGKFTGLGNFFSRFGYKKSSAC